MDAKTIEKRLRTRAPRAIDRTSVEFYDKTYPLLRTAGCKLMEEDSDHCRAILSLGLAGWTMGMKYARKMESLLKHDCSLKSLREQIKELQERLKDADPPPGNARMKLERVLNDVLREGAKLAGLKPGSERISLLSKLLHFLAPWHFVIYDTNVAKAFGAKVSTQIVEVTRTDFLQVHLTLWRQGFHLPSCPASAREGGLQSYWKYVEETTPMRVVDCTFYSAVRSALA